MAEYGLKQMWPDKVTDTNTIAQNGLGVIRLDGEKQYRYAQIIDIAVTLGDSVCAAAVTDGIVSPDRAGGSQLAFQVKGVAIGAITLNSFGWIQTKGICSVQCDGGVVAGDPLIPHATEDGHADTFDSAAASVDLSPRVFGWALTDDASASSGALATAYINCP